MVKINVFKKNHRDRSKWKRTRKTSFTSASRFYNDFFGESKNMPIKMTHKSTSMITNRIRARNRLIGVKNPKEHFTPFIESLMMLGRFGEEIFNRRTFSMDDKWGDFSLNKLNVFKINFYENDKDMFKTPQISVTPDIIYKEIFPIELKTNCSDSLKIDPTWPPMKYILQNGLQCIALNSDVGAILRLNYSYNGFRSISWKSDLDIDAYYIKYDIDLLKELVYEMVSSLEKDIIFDHDRSKWRKIYEIFEKKSYKEQIGINVLGVIEKDLINLF